jgi:UDP-N-acetyl-D-glucosamine dehydrogenase
MKVCVVALGKIGLPLAVQFALSGHTVIGADISASTVELVNQGIPPFPGETSLDTLLPQVVAGGSLHATTNTAAAVRGSDVVLIVVPIVVDESRKPDFRAMDAATTAVAEGLDPGTLVLYETTVPVGTTRHRFGPMLSAVSGLQMGEDFFLAYSPERVFSGRIFQDLRAYPKLVGGTDEASTRKAIEFYESALQFDARGDLPRPNGVWDLGTCEAAELAKLAETTYRDINIAFANELAKFSDTAGIDVGRVIDACNSQPYSQIHQPGIAVGGHCIPVYPHFYLSEDSTARLPAAARLVNDEMPAYAVQRLAEHIGTLEGRRIAVLGAAYRGGVKETAFSGVFGVVDDLLSRKATPLVHDPLYDDDELRQLGFEPYHLGDPCDAAIIQSDHPEYASLDPELLGGATIVVDGRRVMQSHPGLTLISIGAPTR